MTVYTNVSRISSSSCPPARCLLPVGKQQLRAQTSIRPQVCDFRQRVLSILFGQTPSAMALAPNFASSLSLSSLSLSLTHFAHSPLCSHMIYYNIFACASHTLFAAAAMFDLISSKLSSVSTENTSVSFPASLSVSVLVRSSCPLPLSLPPSALLTRCVPLRSIFERRRTNPPDRLPLVGCSRSLFTLPAFAHSHRPAPAPCPAPPLGGVCLILECFLCSICFNLMLFCPEISQLALYSACISDVRAPSMINGIKGFACRAPPGRERESEEPDDSQD